MWPCVDRLTAPGIFVMHWANCHYGGFWSLANSGHLQHHAVVKFVALCVRVGWFCHHAGGSDVVEFPEVILDPDQYVFRYVGF